MDVRHLPVSWMNQKERGMRWFAMLVAGGAICSECGEADFRELVVHHERHNGAWLRANGEVVPFVESRVLCKHCHGKHHHPVKQKAPLIKPKRVLLIDRIDWNKVAERRRPSWIFNDQSTPWWLVARWMREDQGISIRECRLIELARERGIKID